MSLLSSTLPKRTEAMRAHVLAFHAGRSEITTTIPPLTCGCTVPIVATCTMEGNWSARFLPLPRATPSPASWTWRLTPYHLLRTTRSESNIHSQYWGVLVLLTVVFFWHLWCLCFSVRSRSWHLKAWLPLNCILVCCSTAVILERRYLIYCTYYRSIEQVALLSPIFKSCVGLSVFSVSSIVVIDHFWLQLIKI